MDVYTDIDIDDFLSACTSKDIEELLDALAEDGYLTENSKYVRTDNKQLSINEHQYRSSLQKLADNWLTLSPEAEAAINGMAARF